MSTPATALVFPPLLDLDLEHRSWPKPPFSWRHVEPPCVDKPQPCRIDTDEATATEGELLAFDIGAGRLAWRPSAGGPREELPFGRCRRLTLLTPLTAIDVDRRRRQSLRGAFRPIESAGQHTATSLPLAEHERSYRIEPRHAGRVLSGRSVGHVETPEGLFLFEPTADDAALLRVFLPRSVGGAVVTLGHTALESARQGWATSPTALLRQIETLRQRPVPPLGLAAQSLGLLTASQVERCLAGTTDERPLGRIMVDRGLLSHAQLQAVIAHKMGCPVVDLTRFVPEPAALAHLPHRVALAQRSLPLCIVQNRLYVACDQAFDDDRRHALQAYTSLTLAPVLARTAHLSQALRDLERTSDRRSAAG